MQDVGSQLLGVSAAKMREMQQNSDTAEAADRLCLQQHGKRLMASLRASNRVWNNIPSLQFVLQK